MSENSGQNEPQRENRRPAPKRPGAAGPGRGPRSIYSWLLFLMLGLMLVVMFQDMGPRTELIDMQEFRRLLANQEVKQVTVSEDSAKGELKSDAMVGKGEDATASFRVVLPPGVGREEWFVNLLEASGAKWSYETPNGFLEILKLMLPWILILGLMYFFVFRQLRSAGGAGMLGSFGRSRHRVSSKEQSRVTFEDVAGVEEAKDEVQEIIQFLRNPKKFQRLGGRIPRGVLLVGEPGCGKTLLAKAIAGEADVPFFSISGSDFVEMFVGVGASRVRDLFKQAKDNSPCIIFLDEVDAVGRKRGMNIAGGGHDEREQTLNAILVEMDGFDTNDQVIVIAATNRPDVLDNALTRPGRFDRRIYVPMPDIKGRFEILKVHAKKVRLGPDVDLWKLGRGTPMFSGADLEAIINEAALAATLADKDWVEMVDMEEARDKVRWGRARRSQVIDERERETTAYHESGHALVQSLLPDADPVHKVSIIPRTHMGGATFSLPEKDRTLYTRKYLLALIRICFGGRVAEEIACGDVSSGAQADIQQATEIARRMVMDWGMSEKLGFIRYGGEDAAGMAGLGDFFNKREYSDRTAEMIDQEIKSIMDAAYEDVKGLLEKHREPLEALKEGLTRYETLDGEEVRRVMKGEKLDRTTVRDLLDVEQRRSQRERAEREERREEEPGLGGAIPEPGMG